VGVSQAQKVPRSIGRQRSTDCTPYTNIPPPGRVRALRRVIGFTETVGQFAAARLAISQTTAPRATNIHGITFGFLTVFRAQVGYGHQIV
jgi:hypothetical protein